MLTNMTNERFLKILAGSILGGLSGWMIGELVIVAIEEEKMDDIFEEDDDLDDGALLLSKRNGSDRKRRVYKDYTALYSGQGLKRTLPSREETREEPEEDYDEVDKYETIDIDDLTSLDKTAYRTVKLKYYSREQILLNLDRDRIEDDLRIELSVKRDYIPALFGQNGFEPNEFYLIDVENDILYHVIKAKPIEVYSVDPDSALNGEAKRHAERISRKLKEEKESENEDTDEDDEERVQRLKRSLRR